MEELKKIIEELVDGVKHILSMMEVEASAKMNSLEAKVEKATKRMNEAMLRELEVHEPFPCFDGSDPRGWIIKCLRFFRIYSCFTEHQKVVYATQHFEGKAEVWIQQLMKGEGKENLEWRGFVKAILCRFDDGDLFEDFRNLRQTSTVRKYTEEFEALCGLVIFVLEEEGSIDTYLMQCFISGLRAEFRATLRMFNPSDLQEAFRIAKLHETNVQDLAKILYP